MNEANAKIAIETLLNLIPFAMEHKNVVRNALKSIFNPIRDNKKLSDEQAETEIDIIFAGICLLTITAHQKRYEDICEHEKLSGPYLWYPEHETHYKSAYYPKSYDDVIKISDVPKPLILDQLERLPDIEIYKSMVLAVGRKAISGELPFNGETLKNILDKHMARPDFTRTELTPELYDQQQSNVALLKQCIDKIKSSYQANNNEDQRRDIELRFLNAARKAPQSNFIDQTKALKDVTLANFEAKKLGFDFDDCKLIADNVFTLAVKIQSKTLTANDVDTFINNTKKYNQCSLFAASIAILIGAVFGMISGAAIGIFVGPGLIMGAGGGLVTGGIVAGLSYTIWATKNAPLNAVADAARNSIQKSSV